MCSAVGVKQTRCGGWLHSSGGQVYPQFNIGLWHAKRQGLCQGVPCNAACAVAVKKWTAAQLGRCIKQNGCTDKPPSLP